MFDKSSYSTYNMEIYLKKPEGFISDRFFFYLRFVHSKGSISIVLNKSSFRKVDFS